MLAMTVLFAAPAAAGGACAPEGAGRVVQVAAFDLFESSSGACRVAGPVVAAFRGEAVVGEVVRAYFDCEGVDLGALGRAAALELHTDAEDRAVPGGVAALAAPTGAPTLGEGC